MSVVRTRSLRHIPTFLAAMAALAIGCGGDSGDGKSADSGGSGGDKVKMIDLALGAVLPTSGPNASVGKEMADASQMAVDEWSTRFAEKGADLRFYPQDDASDPKQAVSAAYARRHGRVPYTPASNQAGQGGGVVPRSVNRRSSSPRAASATRTWAGSPSTRRAPHAALSSGART